MFLVRFRVHILVNFGVNFGLHFEVLFGIRLGIHFLGSFLVFLFGCILGSYFDLPSPLCEEYGFVLSLGGCRLDVF